MKKIKYKRITRDDFCNLPRNSIVKGYWKVVEGELTTYIKDGIWYKTDGPARISQDGYMEWAMPGRITTEIEFLKTSLVGKELLEPDEK